jgi:hypothetical protein
VGGVATCTFLSLLYVPVADTHFDSFGVLMGRLFSFKLRAPFWAAGGAERLLPRNLRRLRCRYWWRGASAG